MKKQLRVGFDLDGVLLYNPARIVRPIVAAVKNIFFKKNKVSFYFPKSKLEKFIWLMFHKSSLFIAPGFKEILKLVKEKKIKAYIVSSRYSFLKEDFEKWLKKLNVHHLFSGIYFNQKDKQPHIFKEELIKKLKLDIFVEDNWDVANYLNVKCQMSNLKTKILWIYNLFDRNISYSNKFSGLKKSVDFISRQTSKKKTKVLIVTDYFYPHWTGISKSLLYLSQSLKEKIDFNVLTVRFDSKLKSSESVMGVRILRENYLLNISRVKYSPQIIFKSISEIKKNDVVLINSPCSNILPISILTKLFGKKLLVFHQGDLILPSVSINRLIEVIFDVSSFISFFLADKISTYTLDYAHNSRVMKPFLSKLTSLLLPIPTNVILTLSDPERAKSRLCGTKRVEGKSKLTDSSVLSLPQNNKVGIIIKNLKEQNKLLIGFAGRFVEEKGFDILFESIPNILKNIPNAHFIFAGETNIEYENFYKNNLKTINLLKNNLTFLGLLDDRQMNEFYKNIELIIIPSRSDCFNLVQAEAMLNKVPSIVSNIPGARFLVKKTSFGRIFQNENPVSLASQVIYAVKHKEEMLKNYPKVFRTLDNQINTKLIKKFIEE